ncbi:DUF2726 domain-containing protein [Brucella sp. NBRC 14130]|uniref:DUF2726 domain-containing protein n=1 Tax=Brucella sp. NBRC 14130 TaxID=3075483 RepID=UPI0033419561
MSSASFDALPLLNKSEAAYFYAIEDVLTEPSYKHARFRLFAQVSLGEILRSHNRNAFSLVNSKRVDMLIVDRYGMPVAAIEYNGGGRRQGVAHYQGDALLRDAIKREAFRKAGIAFVEITENDVPSLVQTRIREILTLRSSQ